MMRRLVIDLDDPKTKAALDELEALIRARYPDAVFDRYINLDPAGPCLYVELDIDDAESAYMVYGERLNEMVLEGPPYIQVREHRLRQSVDEDSRDRRPANGVVAKAAAPHHPRRKAAPPPA
jgi:hypothetical protein